MESYEKVDPDNIIEILNKILEKIKQKKINTQLNTNGRCKMVNESNEDFEFDEEKALKDAFAKARKSGKLFNVNRWKADREKQRVKLNLPVSDEDGE